MEPQISSQPAFTVVGLRIRTRPKSGEISALWADSDQRLMAVPNAVRDHAYGVMEMVDMDAGIMEYMAGVAVTAADNIPQGLSRWDVPAGTYAVFETTLPELGQAFDAFYGAWLPNSNYQRAAGPEFEHYGPDFDPHDAASKLSVYIPVKPR